MKNIFFVLLVIGLVGACDSDPSDTTQTDGAKSSPPSKTVDPKSEAGTKAEAESADGVEHKKLSPNAADKEFEVRQRKFNVDDFPAELPKGEALGGFAFVDSAGENFIVFTRESFKSDGGNLILHIKHVLQTNDEVGEVRSYTDRVEKCTEDITLKPQFGAWSVSDVDGDGIGEANFAYSAACAGGIDPMIHKVFITEGGKKYVLRGRTKIKLPDVEPFGGEYKADKMPAVFLKKAKDIWADTSKGFGMN